MELDVKLADWDADFVIEITKFGALLGKHMKNLEFLGGEWFTQFQLNARFSKAHDCARIRHG